MRDSKINSVNCNSLNKSVNFSQYPIHSDTSSINDGTTTIGNQSITTEKPKSILKNKGKGKENKDNKKSNNHDKFNRNNPFGASIRRGVSENDHPDGSLNKSFGVKSRRVKSIEQGLNKSWGGGSKGANSGFYSDADCPSDSSSTLGDSEDEYDTNGDWEREAIALAHSKVINSVTPTSRNSRKDFVAKHQKPPKEPEIIHSNYSYNLDQFEKTSKKLKKQRKKQKKLSGKPGKQGKPCTIQ